MHNRTLDYYNSNAPQMTGRYEQAKLEQLHENLLRTFTRIEKLLEIGCGSGREASFLIRNGFNVRCIEGSEKMAAEAARRHPELEGRIDVRVLPDQFPRSNTYDGIYCIAVFMHFPEKVVRSILRDINTILKTGGKLMFSVPLTRPDLTESGFDLSGRFFLLLTETEWIKLTSDAGFRILDTETTGDGMSRSAVIWFTCIAEKPA
jgi:cyclopropane fatty-acyl-phospholipid synthase-like methyltransferase